MAKKLKSPARVKNKQTSLSQTPDDMRLIRDIRILIQSTREKVAQTVNSAHVLLYWSIGRRILRDILRHQRAEYGKEIVSTLSRQLTQEFGPGFTSGNLFHMLRFAEAFQKKEIVYALSRQLGWSHFRQIIYLKEPLAREFYVEMCRLEQWSTRTLQKKIQSMLFERTALSRKSGKLIKEELKALREEDKLTPDLVFRDPYLLDFLGLADTYAEKDLEAAILREMESFLIELGNDFAFLGRQKRITIGQEDYYLDLLFFHRKLRRLVAIELKLGAFQASDKGQMELYLRWLDKHERQDGEEPPIGLILCAGKSDEHVELLQLEKSDIKVATYLTKLLPRKELQQKLHEAIFFARDRIVKTKQKK
jgi:predicted nuclease of restriction endonuclease-like (RecB) superfamily